MYFFLRIYPFARLILLFLDDDSIKCIQYKHHFHLPSFPSMPFFPFAPEKRAKQSWTVLEISYCDHTFMIKPCEELFWSQFKLCGKNCYVTWSAVTTIFSRYTICSSSSWKSKYFQMKEKPKSMHIVMKFNEMICRFVAIKMNK